MHELISCQLSRPETMNMQACPVNSSCVEFPLLPVQRAYKRRGFWECLTLPQGNYLGCQQLQPFQGSLWLRPLVLYQSCKRASGLTGVHVCRHRAASMDGDEAGRAVTLFQVAASGDGGGSTTVQLAHTQDQECGGHILQLSCGLWVYNCTGMPLALLQGDLDDSRQQEPNEVRPFYLSPELSKVPMISPLSQGQCRILVR